jgi:hypothetical protein
MKLKLLVLGIILLSVGLALIATANTIKLTEKIVSKNNRDTWKISGYFEKGDKIIASFTPGTNWRSSLSGLEEIELYLNITTDSNVTRFFVILRNDPQYGLFISDIELMSSDGLEVGEPPFAPEDLGGIAKVSGNYTLFLEEPYPIMHPDPPSLYLKKNEKIYPYAMFLIPGVLTSIPGIILLMLGVRKTKTPRRLKRTFRGK